jgi:hypothetical protein
VGEVEMGALVFVVKSIFLEAGLMVEMVEMEVV